MARQVLGYQVQEALEAGGWRQVSAGTVGEQWIRFGVLIEIKPSKTMKGNYYWEVNDSRTGDVRSDYGVSKTLCIFLASPHK